MAEEEQAQEKTEEPSAKRLKESREKGQVARSKDFNALVILLGTGGAFYILGGYLATHMKDMMRQAFEFDKEIFIAPYFIFQHVYQLAKTGLFAVLPLLVVIAVLSIIAPLLMGGWVFSGQSLQPKFSRMNPLKGFGRMVSLKGFVEMIKSFLKFLLVAAVGIIVLKLETPHLFKLAYASIDTAVASGLTILIKSFIAVCASLIFIAAIDVPFQLYEHSKQLKMTKQELKDEYKETEGKPEVKSQIRRTQQEIARRRMMQEVPKASVVLTNPTHYAVAIAYQQTGNRAPYVVAKGKDLMAMQINKIAKANDVPLIQVPPLARAVYFSTNINEEIPRGLYVAVAQVLAYIFQLNDKKAYEHRPEFLQNVPIPPDFQRPEEVE